MAGTRTEMGAQTARKHLDRKQIFLISVSLVLVALMLAAVVTSPKAISFLLYVLVGSVVCTAVLIGFFILAEKYGERVLYWLGLVSSRKSS